MMTDLNATTTNQQMRFNEEHIANEVSLNETVASSSLSSSSSDSHVHPLAYRNPLAQSLIGAMMKQAEGKENPLTLSTEQKRQREEVHKQREEERKQELASYTGVFGRLKRMWFAIKSGAEFIGEVVADFFGITDSKYQYVIDAYQRDQEELQKQKEKEEMALKERLSLRIPEESEHDTKLEETEAGLSAPSTIQNNLSRTDSPQNDGNATNPS